jgi:hypothetical protein
MAEPIEDAMHPIDECTNRIRQAIKDAIKKASPEQLNDLFDEIREVVQALERAAIDTGGAA